MRLKQWIGLGLATMALQSAQAGNEVSASSQLPILVVGASYAEGKTPFNNGIAPLGGVSVGSGSYLSLGQALTREPSLPGYVINEAQAGATTFARLACPPGGGACGPAGWDGYATQLQHALARVAVPPALTSYNAKYVVIVSPNDCIHSDAFGIPQNLSQPCTLAQLNQVADRMVAVGNQARAAGLTPIYDRMVRYQLLDLNFFRNLYGLNWVISEADYNTMRDLITARVRAEVPGAMVVDFWRDFKTLGDGLHPTPETTRGAARMIARAMREHDAGH